MKSKKTFQIDNHKLESSPLFKRIKIDLKV